MGGIDVAVAGAWCILLAGIAPPAFLGRGPRTQPEVRPCAHTIVVDGGSAPMPTGGVLWGAELDLRGEVRAGSQQVGWWGNIVPMELSWTHSKGIESVG
jgi:hypothetical protein